jgi:hypothetical protein
MKLTRSWKSNLLIFILGSTNSLFFIIIITIYLISPFPTSEVLLRYLTQAASREYEIEMELAAERTKQQLLASRMEIDNLKKELEISKVGFIMCIISFK